MTVIKGIGAIIAGFAAVFILSVGTDFILEKIGIFPSTSDGGLFVSWMLILAFAYRSLYAVLGGYVTVLLAPEKKSTYVIILGILGTLGGIAGVIAGWNLSAHWYPIALAVTAFPLVWLGGWLNQRFSAAKTNIEGVITNQ